MEKNKTLNNHKLKLFKRVILITILLVITLVLIEQRSVYNTLKGDGKIHQAITRPDTPFR